MASAEEKLIASELRVKALEAEVSQLQADKKTAEEDSNKRKLQSSKDTADAEPKAKRGRPKNEQGAPSKPKSAKDHYIAEEKPKLKSGEMKTASLGDITKLLKERWNGLSAEDKKPYEDIANTDKKDYEKAMGDFNATKRNADGEPSSSAAAEPPAAAEPKKTAPKGPKPAKKAKKAKKDTPEPEEGDLKPEAELTNLIRLCRRLQGGSSIGNLKKMCKALGKNVDGKKPQLQNRVERALEAAGFATAKITLEGLPSAADCDLDIDAFNDKFEDQTVITIAKVTDALEKLKK